MRNNTKMEEQKLEELISWRPKLLIQNDAILACIAMSLLFCILGCGIWWHWVAKMGERNYEVLVYGE